MPHLHDCKVIADFVEQGRSEVERVYLRGGRKRGGRKRRARRNGGRSKKGRRESSMLEKGGKSRESGKVRRKEGQGPGMRLHYTGTQFVTCLNWN